jgi:hypothetical protein
VVVDKNTEAPVTDIRAGASFLGGLGEAGDESGVFIILVAEGQGSASFLP